MLTTWSFWSPPLIMLTIYLEWLAYFECVVQSFLNKFSFDASYYIHTKSYTIIVVSNLGMSTLMLV
jgi:hypothetical protein